MRRTTFPGPLLRALGAASLLCGCEALPPGLHANSALFPLEGPCPEAASSGQQPLFTSEVQSLLVRVTGPGIDEPIEATGGLSTLTLEGIPAGEDRAVALFGRTADGVPTWRGMRAGVTVLEEQDTAVEVLLAKVADLSCPRTPLSGPRVFHTATQLDDGRVLLVGGAGAETDASVSEGPGARRLTAVATAELYDPATGAFSVAGSLQVERMFHTATKLPDGRVVIVGGVSEAVTAPVGPSNRFPLYPDISPTSLIEVFDPASGTFSTAGDDPAGPRMFHAASLTAQGELLITGGVPGAAPNNDLSNALSSATVCSGAQLLCITGVPMQRPRAGHTTSLLDNGDVLLWGGSVDPSGGPGLEGYKPEVYRGGQFVLLDTAGFSSNALNLFFAATTAYSGYRVVSAGGLVRAPDGSFRLSALDDGGVARGPVFVFDATPEGGNGAVSAGPYVDDGTGGEVLSPLLISEPRFFGAAAPLSGGRRAVLAGGFTSLDLVPSAGLELYSESPFAVKALTVGGQPRLLRQARGGLGAVALGDGTVLLTGGSVLEGGARRPVASGEIFTDPEDPGATP